MPKIMIEESHSLPPTEVRRRLEAMSAELSSQYGIDSHWISETEAEIKRTGATGKISCTDSRVCVSLDLSFALSPLKGKIEAGVRSKLKKTLG